jgi:thiol-disulfide isomerase/thioredoxin
MKKYFLILFLLFLFKTGYSQELVKADMNVLDSIKSANKGKVILFNFWATWCRPCVEEFPDLLKLNDNYNDSSFKLVLVSLDFGKSFEEKTMEFLKKNDVDFVTYFNGFKKDEDLINYMSKDWEGSIPATFIYDKKGVFRNSFIGKQSYETFSNAVKKLVNK